MNSLKVMPKLCCLVKMWIRCSLCGTFWCNECWECPELLPLDHWHEWFDEYCPVAQKPLVIQNSLDELITLVPRETP